ncbi:MAG: CRISPR-associated endonuclease Cas2 [Candidatus Jorgensenbacteria bacterium]
MRGDIVLKVLGIAGEGVATLSDLFCAFLEAGYGASYGRLEYQLRERRGECARAKDVRDARGRFQKLLYKLKKDGLIAAGDGRAAGRFSVTKKGRSKLAKLLERRKRMLPPARYAAKPANVYTIVAFDVSEKERKKRAWLREVLRNLGFNRVQQSVWIGKVKIPEQFLRDLERLEIVHAVEIFEITKTGSLHHLV